MTDTSNQHQDLVIFKLDDRHYALPADDTSYLSRAITLTPLPGAPDSVEGMFSFRGRLVPVIDIRSRFNLPAKPQSLHDHIVIGKRGDHLVAIRTDRATDMIRVSSDAIEPVDAAGPIRQRSAISAVIKLENELIPITDLGRLLNDQESDSLNTLLSNAEAVENGVA